MGIQASGTKQTLIAMKTILLVKRHVEQYRMVLLWELYTWYEEKLSNTWLYCYDSCTYIFFMTLYWVLRQVKHTECYWYDDFIFCIETSWAIQNVIAIRTL